MNNKINNNVDWSGSKMVKVGMFKDITGLYTESELKDNNIVEIEFPKEIVEEFYLTSSLIRDVNPDYTMERWLYEISHDALEQCYMIELARERGFEIKRPDGKDMFTISVTENIGCINEYMKDADYDEQETYEWISNNLFEAIECAANNGDVFDLCYMVYLKSILKMPISFGLYRYIYKAYSKNILELNTSTAMGFVNGYATRKGE